MSLPSEPPPDPALKRRIVRPWNRPETEFPALAPVGTLHFTRTEPSEITAVLAYFGGSVGSTHRSDSRWWTWPLPPAGRMDFICQLGAAETRVSVEAQLILDASRRSVHAWSDA
jgi:hypothetical protein